MEGNKCSVDGCTKEKHARGFCGTHYARWRVNGDPLKVRKKDLSGLGCGWDSECQWCGKIFRAFSKKTTVCSTDCRFMFYSKKRKAGECWEWAGPTNLQGYSSLSLNDESRSGRKSVISGHRYSYIKHKGEIPKGLLVMHSCDNPCCVNPDHLSVGTWADNNRDRSLKNRSGSRVFSDDEKRRYSKMFGGENNPNALLTMDQAREIRSLPMRGGNGRGSGHTVKEVANMYGVSASTIKSILSGSSYKDDK